MHTHSPNPPTPAFDSISSCISAFSTGQFIIVLDSPDRENEGDLIIAAQDLTREKMAFMIRHTSGLICAPLTPDRAQTLALPQMVQEGHNADPKRTAYTVSVDAEACRHGTGISAADRAVTCNILANPATKAGDLRRPGHVFPLRARPGGVRERPGHTEAAVEFCKLADKEGIAAICEMVDDGVESGSEGREDGARAERKGAGMMRRDECLEFGRQWGLKVCTIEDLVDYLDQRDSNPQSAVNGLKGADGTGGTNGDQALG